MLRPQLLQKFMQNAAFEKANLFQRQADHLLGHGQYKDLMISVFENVPLFFVFFSWFQYCASLNLQPQTSYLAKTYLDLIFNKSNFLDIAQLSLLSICCIWMAIKVTFLKLKFNEPSEVSNYFSIEIMCQHGGHAFSGSDVIAMELRILQLLQFRLSYSTPYDYIEPFFQSFPWMFKAKSALRSIIELSGSISLLRNASAGDIFYGSFMGIIELKQCILQPLQKNILASQIRDAQKIRVITSTIVQRYNEMLQSEQKDESQMQSEQTQSQ